jgi:thiol-disulfide isomerase/thioredoxin
MTPFEKTTFGKLGARAPMLAVTVSASALLFGCTTDGSAPNALTAATPTAAEVAAPARTPATVDNFMLADTDYMGHELYRTDAKVVVLISHANGCPIVRNLAPAIRELKAKYAGQGVEFLLVNSALQDNRESIAKENADYDFGAPILMDANQLVGEQLGVTRTGEFFVVDTKTWKITYRGPLDDRLDYGTQKGKAEHTWAADAIEATLAGRQIGRAHV